MCGRMIVKIEGKAYYKQFSSQENGWDLVVAPERYQRLGDDEPAREVRPTDRVVLHRVRDGELVPDEAFWTLVPPWTESATALRETGDGPRLVPPPQTHFNSRRDTLLKTPAWRRLLASQRGVLLADAFLEWSDEESLAAQGGVKMVGRFGLTGNRLMPLACVWNDIRIGDRTVTTCSVITVPPNDLLVSLPHHRMPAILLGSALGSWLSPHTPDPERCLQTTLGADFESTILPAANYATLVPEARPARRLPRSSAKPPLPDLFS